MVAREQSEAGRAPCIEVRGLRRAFGDGAVVLTGFDLSVLQGEFLAILGPSGCGKSTLLRLIAGLDRPDAGSVTIDPSGEPIRGRSESTVGRVASRVAFVFQDAHLLPWRSVLDNVALPLELLQVGREERTVAAEAAIADVGLSEAIAKYPAQLSGGMRMRVSIARALVTSPRILLLDEPFAALDEITRQRLDEKLHTLWARRAMTVLFVTHSTTEAVFLAERAVVLSRRPGRIVRDQPIRLPQPRVGAMRGLAEFAREGALLFEALEAGAQESAFGHHAPG